MLKINLVKSSKQTEIVAELATIIWQEHYIPIIGIEQVDYMLDKFQSPLAITEQITSGYEYYLLKLENENVGYISIQKRNDTLFLSKIYIVNYSRGKGVGKEAMAFIAERARQLECTTITLTVNKYNSNSIKAYEKIGFVKTNAIVQDIGNGYVMDDFVFEKKI